MNPFQEGVDDIKPALRIGGDAIGGDNGCYGSPDDIVNQTFQNTEADIQVLRF